jgi:CHAT domain-containing protein
VRHGRLAWLAGALIVTIWPAAALAQPGHLSPADLLCTPATDAAPHGYAADQTLTAVADTVEAHLAALSERGDASSAEPVELDVALTASAAPARASLARYCAAAGELMRLSAKGSLRQAQLFLFSAFRLAATSEGPLAARAAYRLALVGAHEPGASGSRGASDSPPPGATDDSPTALPADSACAALTPEGIDQLSSRDLSSAGLACAAEQAERSGDLRLAALAGLKLAQLEGNAEVPDADRETFRGFARERLQHAIGFALRSPADAARVELIGRLADATVDYGDRDSPALHAALDTLVDPADSNAASIRAAIQARLALVDGQNGLAQQLAQSSILAESRRPLPARLPLRYLLLAEADPAHRVAHIEAAYVALDNLRPLLPRLDPLTEESGFSLYMRSVFEAAAEAQLADGGTAHIQQAQEIVETYRQAELQSAFGSECLPPRQALPLQDLRPGETILYPLLLPDRVELLVVSAGEGGNGAPRYRRLAPNRNIGRAEVARLVEAVALPLSHGESPSREASRTLYDIFIAPVADRLGPHAMLAIVPDGALRALPFAALLAPNGQYLVQKTRLSIIPALAFSQPAGATETHGLSVVAASLQREMLLPAGHFPALEGTAHEAEIAAHFARQGRLVPDFTRATLAGALRGRVDVLHLATHAAFNGRSERAFIVANGEVIRLSELRDLIAGARLRGEAIDLIILSACETAVGDDETGMGLAGAAVQAGARSVIGSLWQVNDEGTAELMRQFYQRYSAGEPRSEALQQAQLALIEGGGANAAPNIWAAFALLGAWR